MQEIIKRLKTIQNRLLLTIPERLRPFFKTIRTTNQQLNSYAIERKFVEVKKVENIECTEDFILL